MINDTDKKFLAAAAAIGHIFSKDPSTKVGALAVGGTKNQVAWGYNGFPPGLYDTHERLHDRQTKYGLTLHAEENALTNARFPVRTLYVTHHPCGPCALRILAHRTVRRVVYAVQPDFETRADDSWAESLADARAWLEEGGVQIEGWQA